MIHILRPPDADGVRVPDEVDPALLEKREGRDENDNEVVDWVEYRLPGDDLIVHRSVHVTLKKWPQGLGAIAQPIA